MKTVLRRGFRFAGVIGLLAAIVVFAGCRPNQPILVDLTYIPPDENAEKPGGGAEDVVIHLSPVVDDRSNRDTIGKTTVSVIPESDVMLWVQEGLTSLGDWGYDLRLSGSDPPEGYRLRVTVSRVYCRSAMATLRSTIILSVEYYRGGELLGKRVHRGETVLEDRSPLEGTYRFNEGRVLEALNGGLGDAVGQIAATLAELEGS
ncbi:MAG: hypothetical protein ABIK65_02330 [Candidatus Eisenbacteria bacterium]